MVAVGPLPVAVTAPPAPVAALAPAFDAVFDTLQVPPTAPTPVDPLMTPPAVALPSAVATRQVEPPIAWLMTTRPPAPVLACPPLTTMPGLPEAAETDDDLNATLDPPVPPPTPAVALPPQACPVAVPAAPPAALISATPSSEIGPTSAPNAHERHTPTHGAGADAPLPTAPPTLAPTAPVARAQPPAPVDTVVTLLDQLQHNDWLDGVARDIARAADGDAPLRFVLTPDRLGRIAVALERASGGYAVGLEAAQPETRTLLTVHQPQLAEQLRRDLPAPDPGQQPSTHDQRRGQLAQPVHTPLIEAEAGAEREHQPKQRSPGRYA